MKIRYSFLKTGFLLFTCVLLKTGFAQTERGTVAIQKAIADFSKKCKLYKQDSVFSVRYRDTVFKILSQQINKYTSKSVRGPAFDGIAAVTILGRRYRFLMTKNDKIGSKSKLPSRVMEQQGKLFYWYDEDYPLTENALALLKKYNRLVDDQGGRIIWLDNVTDDAKKGADYYFCRGDFSKYKKVITSAAMGYYEPPKIRCSR